MLLFGTKNKCKSSLAIDSANVVIRDKKWLNVAIEDKISLGVLIKFKKF
jgi:hypothetical protein